MSGFKLHASISVGARDRARLERLCRYLLRPPIALERREEHPSGKLRYSLKKPWSDGSVAVLLEPEDLQFFEGMPQTYKGSTGLGNGIDVAAP